VIVAVLDAVVLVLFPTVTVMFVAVPVPEEGETVHQL
jgi:hypothetical protein